MARENEFNRNFWVMVILFSALVVSLFLLSQKDLKIDGLSSDISKLRSIINNQNLQIAEFKSYIDSSNRTFYAQSIPFYIHRVGYIDNVKKGHITFDVVCPIETKTYYISEGSLYRLGYPELGKEIKVGGMIC